LNQIDLNGDKTDDMVIISRRENFNAHRFDVVSFYVYHTDPVTGKKQLNIVPIFDNKSERLEYIIGGGADCMLHDFRVYKNSKTDKTILVTADRELTQGYVASEKVEFSFFELTENTDGIPGFPIYYFDKNKTTISKDKHCDVNKAFEKELNLSNTH